MSQANADMPFQLPGAICVTAVANVMAPVSEHVPPQSLAQVRGASYRYMSGLPVLRRQACGLAIVF